MWTKKGPGKTIFPYVWNNLVHSALGNPWDIAANATEEVKGTKLRKRR